MNLVVIKRNGERVNIDINRIKKVIEDASNSFDSSFYEPQVKASNGFICSVLLVSTVLKVLLGLHVRYNSYKICIASGLTSNQCIGRIRNRSPPISFT